MNKQKTNKHGFSLKLFLFDDRTTAAAQGVNVDSNIAAAVADYGGSPAMFAYALQDEPTAPFPSLAAAVSAIRAKDPAHYGYVNLLPNYASAVRKQTNKRTYKTLTNFGRASLARARTLSTSRITSTK